MNMIRFRHSTADDFTKIIELLSENRLPTFDVVFDKQLFIVAEAGKDFLGCIGLEITGEYALLRSMAVKSSRRNLKIGRDLHTKMIQQARRLSVKQLFLLTTTAELYFERIGWKAILRTEVPDEILASPQFSTTCPGTATCMTYFL